ncbi:MULTISPECIES: I78 family peptidase inhibitor [Pseudomonas]|uniref:I78 family peptidase inhibitor n=1 Tax=Pseudomonas TaxID=286 RepID=UPI000D6F6600|nr:MULTISPECIES: I78 family peptidase inhibitor [unclassified Pseudomonas]MED5608122.1 I78 family peptidase inhibitor [Pseudomonas sp. JH-2]PWU30212.1 hypothetical protein DK254_08830 [Pseudomonas sp. RW407]
MPLNRALPAMLFGAILLAGCSSADKPAESPAAAPEAGRCNAGAVQSLVGKPLSQALVEQARRDAGAQNARVLHPHDAVTLEYNSQRLNINVDDRELVRGLNCG